MRGNESQKMTAAVAKLAFASLLLAKAGADIGTIKRVFGATDIKEVATGRKERTVNCLATFKPHKKACAERLLSRLIETAGKPVMIDIGTTAASCWFTIADSAFQAATTGDAGVPPEVAALATDKEAFFQQSKAVSTKWWNQSNGKGPGTAAMMKHYFKEAQEDQKRLATAGNEGSSLPPTSTSPSSSSFSPAPPPPPPLLPPSTWPTIASL